MDERRSARPAQVPHRAAGSGRGGARGAGRWPPGTLFALLDAPTRAAMLTLGRAEEFETGRDLVRQGERGDRVYVLLSGTAKVTAVGADGEVALLALRVGGDLVGEMAVLGGRARSATVSTVSPVLTQIVDAGDFRRFLVRHPAANHALQSMLAGRLQGMIDDRVALTGSTYARLCRLLVRLAAAHGRPHPRGVVIGVPLSQRDLAALIAAAEVSVQRGISRLRAAGILAESSTGGLVIVDAAGLRRAVTMAD
ncbi:Crp/Fnr family transcriptional regulator [Frankia sp. AgB32]|uniref:Crp/Fnr family transcriptional regulator n=1 Tax=Frankia sp. AgB32 TaxID=631119 RepID=UPI0020100E99|nr:Crp/Fnr family transcriptional regulator [Frankia sp. AgB32]MCK9893673.1 Crp/Fnr family transcriptional regulator [Frankia sp. AgB32]